jgi:hypothetical protein
MFLVSIVGAGMFAFLVMGNMLSFVHLQWHALIGISSLLVFGWVQFAKKRLPPTRARAVGAAMIGGFCLILGAGGLYRFGMTWSFLGFVICGSAYLLLACIIWRRAPRPFRDANSYYH